MGTFYRCTAFVFPEQAIITTNDIDYYNRLIELDGIMICHPNLFDSSHQQGEESDLNQCAQYPYVVQIQKDKLAQIQSVPIDKYESYETRLYCLDHVLPSQL